MGVYILLISVFDPRGSYKKKRNSTQIAIRSKKPGWRAIFNVYVCNLKYVNSKFMYTYLL